VVSKPLYRPIAAVSLLMVSLIVLTGCPDPNRHLWFYGETKMKKTYKTRLLDNRVQLEIISVAHVFTHCDEYRLSLEFVIKRSDPMLPLDINRHGVVVLVDTLRMSPFREHPIPVLDTLSDRKFRLWSDLEIDANVAGLRERGRIPVRIVLDSLLTLSGEPVKIDTVRALETQECPIGIINPQ
jgi:hypothetical protein